MTEDGDDDEGRLDDWRRDGDEGRLDDWRRG